MRPKDQLWLAGKLGLERWAGQKLGKDIRDKGARIAQASNFQVFGMLGGKAVGHPAWLRRIGTGRGCSYITAVTGAHGQGNSLERFGVDDVAHLRCLFWLRLWATSLRHPLESRESVKVPALGSMY